MQVTFRRSGSCLIVRLTGDVDHHSCDIARHQIDDAYHRLGALHMVFDCQEIPFMDSSVLGLLMGRYRLVSSLGGQVLVSQVSARLDRILSLSGLYKLLRKAPDTETALKMLEGEGAYV